MSSWTMSENQTLSSGDTGRNVQPEICKIPICGPFSGNLWALKASFLKHYIWIMPHIFLILYNVKTLPCTWLHVSLTTQKCSRPGIPVPWQDRWGLWSMLEGFTGFQWVANRRLIKDGARTKVRFLRKTTLWAYSDHSMLASCLWDYTGYSSHIN